MTEAWEQLPWLWGKIQRCVGTRVWAVPAAQPCLSEQEAMLRRGGLPSLRAEYRQLSLLIGNIEGPVPLCSLRKLW